MIAPRSIRSWAALPKRPSWWWTMPTMRCCHASTISSLPCHLAATPRPALPVARILTRTCRSHWNRKNTMVLAGSTRWTNELTSKPNNRLTFSTSEPSHWVTHGLTDQLTNYPSRDTKRCFITSLSMPQHNTTHNIASQKKKRHHEGSLDGTSMGLCTVSLILVIMSIVHCPLPPS